MSQAEQSSNQAQNDQQSSNQQIPQSCKGGCGFYGNKDYGGYCSVCFKNNLTQEQQDQLLQAKKDKENESAANESKEELLNATEENPKKVQKKKNRCWECRKKITLAGRFECKCGYVFCSAHRFADAHNCQFDYQAEHKKKLETQNEVVAPSKLNKI